MSLSAPTSWEVQERQEVLVDARADEVAGIQIGSHARPDLDLFCGSFLCGHA